MAAIAQPAAGTTIAYSTDGSVYTILGQVLSIGHAGGGEVGSRDTTTLTSAVKTKAPTIPDNGEVTFTLNFDPTDTGHQQLMTWKNSPPTTIPFWKVTFAVTGTHTVVFNGFVSNFDGANAGSFEDNLAADVTITVTGGVTVV